MHEYGMPSIHPGQHANELGNNYDSTALSEAMEEESKNQTPLFRFEPVEYGIVNRKY